MESVEFVDAWSENVDTPAQEEKVDNEATSSDMLIHVAKDMDGPPVSVCVCVRFPW